jgi:hypothetical protein
MEVSRRRSKLMANPLCAINGNSREGRAIYDRAVMYLDQCTADTSNPLVVQDAIAASQLALRVDALRADPNSNPLDITRLEWIVRCRLRAIGIMPPRKRRASLPSTKPVREMSDAMREVTT